MTAKPGDVSFVKRAADEGFTRGLAYAATQIVRLHNHPVVAVDVILESGIPADEFRACVDGYDLAAIRRLVRKEPRLAEWWAATCACPKHLGSANSNQEFAS